MVVLSGSVLSVFEMVPLKKKKSFRKIPGLQECEHLFGFVRCLSAGKNNNTLSECTGDHSYSSSALLCWLFFFFLIQLISF